MWLLILLVLGMLKRLLVRFFLMVDLLKILVLLFLL